MRALSGVIFVSEVICHNHISSVVGAGMSWGKVTWKRSSMRSVAEMALVSWLWILSWNWGKTNSYNKVWILFEKWNHCWGTVAEFCWGTWIYKPILERSRAAVEEPWPSLPAPRCSSPKTGKIFLKKVISGWKATKRLNFKPKRDFLGVGENKLNLENT